MAEGNIKPNIGLVAENDLNRHLLAKLLAEAGYHVALSLKASELEAVLDNMAASDTPLDAWLLDSDEHSNDGGQSSTAALDNILERSEVPLLVSDEIPSSRQTEAFQLWRRRLFEKLELIAIPQAAGDTTTDAGHSAQVDQVWVLAASYGGPEAVKRFLSALPAALPVAMVYGQHIDNNFDQVLRKAVAIDHQYPVTVLRGRSHLQRGAVAVVPADRQVRFLPRGEVVETRQRWSGPYQPSLDQIIAELARHYRERLGVIVFSGMCNDGEIGCRVAAACGSTVWVQTPETCMSADMPNAALATGSVTLQGSPEELAQALGKSYNTARRQVGRPVKLSPQTTTLRPAGQS